MLEVRCEELLEHFQALEAINHPQLSKLLYLEKFTKYDELSYAFSHFSLRLFSEFMEVRLGDIGNIPDHHLYHLLYETLAGFQAVFHNVRPIRASPLNIGFNKKNELKIVLYEDLSREPTNEITEEAVVQSVLDVYKSYIGNRLTIPQAMKRISIAQTASAENMALVVSLNKLAFIYLNDTPVVFLFSYG